MTPAPCRALPVVALMSMVCSGGSAFRQRHQRKGAKATAVVHASPAQGTQFRGRFRDMNLWVEAASGPMESSPTASLWVVEYESAEEMAAERRRAESAGLAVTMQEKLSLVLQGNVPHALGYDACGGETNKTVISVADHAVLERPMPAAAAQKYLAQAQSPDPSIVALLNRVSQDSIAATLTTLQNYQTRNSKSGDVGLSPAADWVAEELQKHGFTVTRDSFRSDYTPQIVAELAGATEPEKIVVLGAHLDSTAGWWSSSGTRSPGADDNGSGSASVLEFAKVIASSGARFRHTLRLCLFTGEEQGLVGSRALATRWSQEGANIIAMFNVDMLGYRTPGTPITINLMDRVGDQDLLNIARAVTSTYLPGIANDNTAACCSDQQSFVENGFPAAGFFETPGRSVIYPQYHTRSDLLEYLDPEQIVTQAKAAFASTALLAELM